MTSKEFNLGIDTLLAGMLTIAFVCLKLTNLIDWSWWWVLSPVWIPFAFAAVVFLVVWVWYKVKARKLGL